MHLTSENLAFGLGSFVVPVLMVGLNFGVRHWKHWYYSAGSDFLLTEMTFGFSSVVLSKDMSGHIRNDYIRDSFIPIYTVMSILLLLCWTWTVSRVEAQINESIRRKRPPSRFPQGKLFFCMECGSRVLCSGSDVICIQVKKC
jgi:hypothetical protein